MSDEPRGRATRQGADRLVYGYAGGVRHGARRTALAVAMAQGLDRGMGSLRLARPVLLVSGFWRSGTTWLQEAAATALGAKTVFEPLSPMEPRRRAALAERFPDDGEDLRQATIPGPAPGDGALWTYLDRSCDGRFSSPYLMSCRRGVGESLCRAIVVKDVRLQANLPAFHHRFGAPVVHVRRHPCAVVASLIASNWHWSFARTPLDALLARLGTALSEGERAWASRFDTDTPSRIAAFWATTERIAATSLAGRNWGAVVSYERFATAPGPEWAALCRTLGLAPRKPADFGQPSATIHPDAFAASPTPRDRWRGTLAPADIARIEAVVEALYPGWQVSGASPTASSRPPSGMRERRVDSGG